MDQNVNEQVDKLKDAVRNVPADLLKWAIIAVVVLVIVYVVLKSLKKRRKPAADAPDLGIDVSSLSAAAPPAAGPSLYCYNVPVRLAAVVLAPAGRVHELPPAQQLADVVNAIVPGLAQVVEFHKPLVRRWPAQLSIRGFANVFASQAKLPGDGGKGTPWCSAAGVVRFDKKPVMVGLVMRAAAPNNLGQAVVEEETQWLSILRTQA
jgi:hypothetical protein